MKERTLRVFANRYSVRPPTETFHEFLIDHLKQTLGVEWWEQQLRKKRDTHVLIDWTHQWCALTRDAAPAGHVPGDVYSVQPTGGPLALLTIADDIYRLSLKRRLPHNLIKRLRVRPAFQGVRYEIAVGAVLVRAGWEVDWIDESKSLGACEAIATYGKGLSFAVEAKSRHRSGVLHQPGKPPSEWVPDVQNLVAAARGKDTQGLPLVIFVDVNVPHTASQAETETEWVREARQLLCVNRSKPREDLLVLTNFAWHLDGVDLALQGEFVIDPLGTARLDERAIAQIRDRLDRYGDLPLDD